MTNRNLLKEAIADAKTIKETAITNAKAALEESFTPHLKSILSAKLNEMEADMYEEDDVEETEELAEENEIQPTLETEAGIDEEIDLDELLAELEMEEKATEDESLYEAKKDESEKDKSKEDDEEIDLENMTEEELKKFIEGVVEDMISAGEIEAGHEGMEDEETSSEEIPVEDEIEVEPETETETELDLDEILFELQNETLSEDGMAPAMGASAAGGVAELAKIASDAYKTAKGKGSEFSKVLGQIATALSAGMTKEGTANEELQAELAETNIAVETLRSELNEINLLNAKLLYTNKIFKSKNLTEIQKVKVLAAFDKATSKKEAQLVYETLIEGLKEKKPIIKENLGRASKPVGAPIVTKQPILESDALVARFQKLAGIIQ